MIKKLINWLRRLFSRKPKKVDWRGYLAYGVVNKDFKFKVGKPS